MYIILPMLQIEHVVCCFLMWSGLNVTAVDVSRATRHITHHDGTVFAPVVVRSGGTAESACIRRGQ